MSIIVAASRKHLAEGMSRIVEASRKHLARAKEIAGARISRIVEASRKHLARAKEIIGARISRIVEASRKHLARAKEIIGPRISRMVEPSRRHLARAKEIVGPRISRMVEASRKHLARAKEIVGARISRIVEASRKHLARAKEIVVSAFWDTVTFLKSPTGERFIVLEIIILTAMTLLLFLLYQKELRRREEFQMSINMIRSSIVGIDSKYADMDDSQILAVAQNLSQKLLDLANMNDQVQKETDILENGWILPNHERLKSLYWFSEGLLSWMDSKRRCESQGAELISIRTEIEHDFLMVEARRRRRYFWIGQYKDKQGKWKILPDTTPINYFWKKGEPEKGIKRNCGAMHYNCEKERNPGYNPYGCCIALICEERKHYICKKKPNDAWM